MTRLLNFYRVIIICLAIAPVCVPAMAQPAAPAQDTPADKGIFKREKDKQEWQKQVEGVDYAKDKDIKITYGDILAAKDESVVFHFSNYQIWMQPFSVFRLNSISAGEGDATAVVPELLFGEALFKGSKGLVMLPGQSMQAQGTVYMVVDEEKYSIVASVEGEQTVLPQGAADPLTIPPAFMMDLGPAGETGEPFEMFEDDVATYSQQEVPEDSPRVSVKTDQQAVSLEALNEYWNQTRVSLLQDGPESEAGLAIARGEHRQKQPEQVETVQTFTPAEGPVQKTLSFSTSVSSGDSKTALEGAPVLTSVTIGGVSASIGEVLNLTHKNIADDSIKVAGRATVANADKWKLVLKINDEETPLDNITSFDVSIRVVQEFPNAPVVYNVTIADQAAQSFEEDSMLTREDMESGRIRVAGNASPGRNILTYKLEFVARDNEDKEQSIGSFQADVDVSELQSVEVSKDDGISWEPASGIENWTFVISPSDGETYKVRARATDVMGNRSEEQFDAYIFQYRTKTNNEMLREVFDAMMRAFLDKDRTTFIRSTSNDYGSNIEDLRDLNELETSIEERFRCCTVNIQYTVQDVYTNIQAKTGSVEFNWTDKTGVSRTTNYAVFNYLYEEGEWKFSEVIDPNTFLRASRTAYFIELQADAFELDADGTQTTQVTARVLDNAGSIVADNVQVNFQTDNGTMSPAAALTSDGNAVATYIAGTSPGTATIIATSGNASNSTTITLNPVAPPLPPDEEQ